MNSPVLLPCFWEQSVHSVSVTLTATTHNNATYATTAPASVAAGGFIAWSQVGKTQDKTAHRCSQETIVSTTNSYFFIYFSFRCVLSAEVTAAVICCKENRNIRLGNRAMLFLLVSHWNGASIFNRIRDIRPPNPRAHTETQIDTLQVTSYSVWTDNKKPSCR